MAIQGSLREASLPDVLQLLALGRKTGCLSVTDRSELGHVYFEQGSICYASIVNRRDRLGDLLVKNGLVEPGVLAEAVEAQSARDGKRLGEILVQRGAITEAQLAHYIRVQIEEAVYYLFTWTQGTFYFEVDRSPPEGAMCFSLNAENVLLEGARRVDEWALIAKKIPSLEMVFGRDPERTGVADAELTEPQHRVLALLDGRRTVQEIIDESGLVEFEAGKALFGLIQAGYVHTVGKRPARVPTGAAAREQEHRNLGIAFYRTRMLEEAEREFRRVLELRPEDLEAHFFLALVALREGKDRSAVRQLQELIEAGGAWPASFHSLGLALERMGRLDDALLCVDEALRQRPDHPSALLSRAVLLCKLGQAVESALCFRRYRERLAPGVAPPAVYYVYAVLAEGACGRVEDALRMAEEGVERYPESAPLLLHAGAVRERMGAWEEAEELYRQAVEQDPGQPAAHKSLGDALYRRGDFEAAALAYEKALELASGRGEDLFFKLANIRFRQGAREEAVRLWKEVLRLNPENGTVRANLQVVEQAVGGARA